MVYILFCLTSRLKSMFMKFIHIVACCGSLCIFIAEYYSLIWIYTVIYLSILIMGTWIDSTLRLLWMKLLSLSCTCFCYTYKWLLSMYIGVELLGHRLYLCDGNSNFLPNEARPQLLLLGQHQEENRCFEAVWNCDLLSCFSILEFSNSVDLSLSCYLLSSDHKICFYTWINLFLISSFGNIFHLPGICYI